MSKKLQSGFTTGTHACAVFVAALKDCIDKKITATLKVTLPLKKEVTIKVKRESKNHFSTVKIDNDDIDVTKRALISCEIFKAPVLGLKKQTPSKLEFKNSTIYVYAGVGVGVVTKDGLKIKPNFPAINPVPLEMMKENSLNILKDSFVTLYAVVSVKDGEKIAKQTANEKVGVIGGISILGTSGIVKPVSSLAYIDSIETEINFLAKQSEELIVFTLGNSAFDYAKKLYPYQSIIEIGNFVYDSCQIAKKHNFKKLIFITSIAKMTKVAQGFKNTHNRYGTLDIEVVKKYIEIKNDREFITLKALLDTLSNNKKELLTKIVKKHAFKEISSWININTVEIIVVGVNR